MTQFPDLFGALMSPFETHEVRSRNQSGKQVHYITARTCMNRLDSILGPENWWDEYVPADNSVLCRLTIRLPDGSTLTKADAGGRSGMPDQGDDDKSGFSDSFKRAAVKFGVGRYLYRDGVPSFAVDREQVAAQPPVVEPAPRPEEPSEPPKIHRPAESNAGKSAPRSGRAFFAWAKEVEQREGIVLIKYLQNWGKLQEFPGRMIDWDAGQVDRAYAEATRKINAEIPA